jgi:nitrite reductase/ring-hydroxylating ferredoxin subunit
MSTRRVAAFVEALLGNRRPRAFKPNVEDADAIRAAIELRAAQPGATLPRTEFVADLHKELARELEGASAPIDELADRRVTRRRVFQGLSVAAAAAAAGVLVDREVLNPGGGATPRASGQLVPTHGDWQPVALTGSVGAGDVARFATPSTVGFVVNDGRRVSAVSGVCTHQGCLLRHNAAKNRLECPCHRAAFSLTGEVLFQTFPEPIAPLPQVQVRQRAGQIEVYAPPNSA